MMSTQCFRRATSGGRNGGRRLSRRGNAAAGLTLVEVLVLSLAATLVVSIPLRHLRHSEKLARAVRCTDTLHRFGVALAQYTADNEGWIPGVNTSGVAIRVKRLLWDAEPSVLHQSHLPVQSWDWMTPLARYDQQALPLPANRAARWNFLWQRYRCPAQRAKSVLYDGGVTPDLKDFLEYAWPACSYLMSAHFQYAGQDHLGLIVGYLERAPSPWPVYAKVAAPYWEVRVDEYLPHVQHFQIQQLQVDQIVAPARKIFVADGTRYMDASGSVDIDIRPDAEFFGAFTSTGGWWAGSNAYGVREGTLNWDGYPVPLGSTSGGRNLPLTYRHRRANAASASSGSQSGTAQDNRGWINAVFFDGHVAQLNDHRSREISLWYPSGGVVQTPDEGMTTPPEGYVIP